MAKQKFRGKYWATLFIEVEFEAADLEDAQEIMDGFPCNKGDIQFKETNGVEERSDFEVEPVEVEPVEILNADVRDLPITMGEHTVRVGALINVAAGLPHDDSFGEFYLDRFEIGKKPSMAELTAWLVEQDLDTVVKTEQANKLLGMMGHIQAEVATAEIKKVADEHGYHCMVLEVDAK